ncbi:MAG: nitrous oxide-stimulated promoter family protein, partial [Erysipelotrichaceae bacterium]
MRTEQKRQKEKVVVGHMVQLYCKKHHGTKGSLCPQCQALLDYAHQRSDRCPRMEAKTFCAHCPIHCYNKEKREQIQVIMRY